MSSRDSEQAAIGNIDSRYLNKTHISLEKPRIRSSQIDMSSSDILLLEAL